VAVPLRPDAAQARVGAAPPVVSSYREYRPGPGAPEAVACTWHGIAGWSRQLRVLPDGRLDVVWDGQQARAVLPVPGPARYPVSAEHQSVGIRIQPGWGAIVLGAPLRHLADVTDLAELWDAMTVRHLEAALAAAPDAAARRRLLSRAVACRLAAAGPPDPAVLGAVRLLSQPRAAVGEAAWHAHLSGRQLRRRFADHVGLPPKTLQAVLRFQRLRERLESPHAAPVTLARAAADCGYFDQAHLCHDSARLAGITPSELLRPRSQPTAGPGSDSGRHWPGRAGDSDHPGDGVPCSGL
jgi:methylphosphotriester-DNA--protein-cysteine methyltransferase